MAVQKSHRSKSKKTMRNNSTVIKTNTLTTIPSKKKILKKVFIKNNIKNFI